MPAIVTMTIGSWNGTASSDNFPNIFILHGFTGQSQALRLAIARALVKINPEDKTALRSEGFMTRDSRSVERKKPGQPKARRRFQFSKR